MRNHVHIFACKIHIDITYILNMYSVSVFLNPKEGMASSAGIKLWEYIFKFPLEAIHSCKLKTSKEI